MVADVRNLPFPDDYADEIRAIHIIEHFHPWETVPVLREWVRVLKPGCMIAIECPCWDKILMLAQVPQMPPNMTFWGIYGDPRHEEPGMMHKWCFNEVQLAKAMSQAGLVNLRPEPPRFHHPIRDMRIVGYKPIKESAIELAK